MGYFVNPHSMTASHFSLRQPRPIELASKEFSEHVQEISANFCCIYNEAHEAEQLGLTQICGVGYRRALEFLIKDCLVSIRPDEKVRVKTVLVLETTSPIQR